MLIIHTPSSVLPGGKVLVLTLLTHNVTLFDTAEGVHISHEYCAVAKLASGAEENCIG